MLCSSLFSPVASLTLAFSLLACASDISPSFDRAMEQEPGRELHQPRGEPHAFGGISERGVALELLGFMAARPSR